MKVSAIPADPAARGFWLQYRTRPDRGWFPLLCGGEDDLRREYRTQVRALKPFRGAEIQCYHGAVRLYHLEDSPP